MKELEINHVAPYLPYDIRVLRPDNKTVLKVTGIRDGNLLLFADKDTHGFYKTSYGSLRTAKLILRPLSDLTKEIEHKGERYSPYIVLTMMLMVIIKAYWLLKKCSKRKLR